MENLSPADSLAIVNTVHGVVEPIALELLRKLKDLDPRGAEWAARLVGAGVASFSVACVRWGMVAVERAHPGSAVSAVWDRVRGVVNPILALLAGYGVGGGDLLVAALPIVMHALQRGTGKAFGKTTPQGVSRAARGAGAVALVAGLLLVAGPAAAGDSGSKLLLPITRTDEQLGGPFASQRWAFTVALGAKTHGWVYSRGTQGFAEAQVAWQWTDAVGLRVGARRIAIAEAPWEPEAKLTFTFAP